MLVAKVSNTNNQYQFSDENRLTTKSTTYASRNHKDAKFIAPINTIPGKVSLDGVRVKDLSTALRQAKDFSEIRLTAGHYQQAGVLTANHVEIIAEPGAVVFGKAVQGKGAIVVKGDFCLN